MRQEYGNSWLFFYLHLLLFARIFSYCILEEMPWDKKHYREIKKWVKPQLGGGYPGSIYGKDVFHMDVFKDMIPELVEKGNYEEAQAIKDAIMEWFNEHLAPGEAPITPDRTLRLQAYKKQKPIGYHLSMGNPDDKYGLEPGYGFTGCM